MIPLPPTIRSRRCYADAMTQVGFEDFLEEENILTEVSLEKKEYSRLHVLSKLSVIPTLDKFILRCGTKFVRV